MNIENWISVRDRIPEDQSEVLIFNGALHVSNYRAVGKRGFWTTSKTNAVHDGVTHWMELPAHPKSARNPLTAIFKARFQA